MDDKYKAFNVLTTSEIIKQKVARNGYTVVIEDLDKRVSIFVDQVVREQAMKNHKGHVAYVAKLAAYLVWVLMSRDRDDLVDKLINSLLVQNELFPEADIDVVAREAAMEQQYILRILDKGYVPQSRFQRDAMFKRTPREAIYLEKELSVKFLYN